MKNIVLVTGGSGYIGSWVVKGLLEKGYTVRMTLRDKSKKEKYEFLTDIADKNKGELEIWEADLLKKGSFDKAALGCDSIIHMASPFILNVKDAQLDLVDPAVKGTSNVLEAANKSNSVRKVILTSSVAAIYGDAIDMKNQHLSKFTENEFNTSSSLDHQPYSFSKVQAEKKAWEIAKQQSSWELIVVNPSFVMGPSLGSISKSESIKFMRNILSGKFKSGAAELYFGYVDVRDVASAHIYCLENKAEGRHILAERVTDILSFSNLIEAEYKDKYKLPKSNNPKWVLSLIGSFFGLSRKFVKNNVGIPIQFDTSKSIEKLHLTYTPLQQTVRDMVDQMESQ